ncbi:MAG TPA: hypothetical protein VE955_01780 [Candidatus Dormibacteraeota bacterium]|nr:hypothetical protein [Candidatus Dormibacteraeota bacterium]
MAVSLACSFARVRILIVILSVALLALSMSGSLGPSFALPPNSLASTTSSGSWNPNVSCTPTVVTIESVLGAQTNSQGGASETGSTFNPGITSPVGSAKRWLTPGPTPPGWISPGPPCTITNANGQVVSAFVEIHRVQRGYLLNEDYSVLYDPVNGGGSYPTGMNLSDTTFNTFTPGYSTCTSTNTTGCLHTIHVEFDHDWKAASYCGPSTSCDPYAMAQATPSAYSSNCQKTPAPAACFIDIQGFVYWDQDRSGDASHSFSGWEIHPLTAWRISTATPTFDVAANPTSLPILPGQSASSTLTVTSVNSFTGTVTLAATSVSQSNSPGPTPTTTINPSSVTLSPGGTGTSSLIVSTSSSEAGNYLVTVTGTSGNLTESVNMVVQIVDFALSANPSSLTIPILSSGQSTITLTSINGFAGTLGLQASVTAASGIVGFSLSNPTVSLSSSNAALSAGGTSTVTLTVSTSLLTTPGTYTVTISAMSGGVTHTTTVNVTVTLL